MATVVILGGGFAGLTAARTLGQRLNPEHRILLINDQPSFVFRPGLIWVAAGLRQPHQISVPIERLLGRHRVHFLLSPVRHVDLARRRVVTDGRIQGYDYLLLALGAHLHFDAIPGLSQHAHTVMTPEQARVTAAAIEGFRGGEMVMATAPETPCVATAYEMAFLLDVQLRRRGIRQRTRITLVTYEETLLSPGGPHASQLVAQRLEERGIGYRLGARLSGIGPGVVGLAGGTLLPSDFTLVVPDYRGHDAVEAGLTAEDRRQAASQKGFLLTDDTMRSVQYPNVFVAGDAADFAGPKSGHIANLQAGVAAHNLAVAITGRGRSRTFRPEILCAMDFGGGQGMFVWRKDGAPGDFSFRGRLPRLMKTGFEKYYLTRVRAGI